MTLEIEQKFLVANDGWKNSVVRSVRIRDGLIANNKGHKESWSRKSAQDDKWNFCLTAATLCEVGRLSEQFFRVDKWSVCRG